jgi:hypothetical protein
VKVTRSFECNFKIIASRPRPFEISELTFKKEITFKGISAGPNVKVELGIHKHAHKECLAPVPETSKKADMEKR